MIWYLLSAIVLSLLAFVGIVCWLGSRLDLSSRGGD